MRNEKQKMKKKEKREITNCKKKIKTKIETKMRKCGGNITKKTNVFEKQKTEKNKCKKK